MYLSWFISSVLRQVSVRTVLFPVLTGASCVYLCVCR
jgi:hypothetical protein